MTHGGLAGSVREQIAARIESGAWRPGQRLPAEPQLASSLGVSRATLREALRSLADDGFLHRSRGAGTFVTHRPRMKNNLDVNFGVTDLIRAMGMAPGTEGLKSYRGRASAEEADRLAIPPDSPIWCVERVRTADGEPVAFTRDVVPAFLVGDDSGLFDRLGQGSIYAILESELGLAIHQGLATIRPARADRRLAAKLRVPRGALLLYLLQVDYDAEGRPVLMSHEYHLAEAFEVTVIRRGPGPGKEEQ